MTYVNDGITNLQAVGIRNETGTTPAYFVYAGSDNTYTGSESSVNNEFIRKSVTWDVIGLNSTFIVSLGATEAVGSTIESSGLVSSATLSTGSLHTINPSYIGLKTGTFNVQQEGEVIIRRPE